MSQRRHGLLRQRRASRHSRRGSGSQKLSGEGRGRQACRARQPRERPRPTSRRLRVLGETPGEQDRPHRIEVGIARPDRVKRLQALCCLEQQRGCVTSAAERERDASPQDFELHGAELVERSLLGDRQQVSSGTRFAGGQSGLRGGERPGRPPVEVRSQRQRAFKKCGFGGVSASCLARGPQTAPAPPRPARRDPVRRAPDAKPDGRDRARDPSPRPARGEPSDAHPSPRPGSTAERTSG